EAARKLLGELVQARPEVPLYVQQLALAEVQLADHKRDTDHDFAEQTYRKALGDQADLAKKYPTFPVYRQDLALTALKLGKLLHAARGQDQDADEAFRAGLAIQAKVVEAFKVADFRRSLAAGIMEHGILLHRQNQLEECEAVYNDALDKFTRLAKEFEGVTLYHEELANIHVNLGILYQTTNRPALAEASYDLPLRIRTALAEKLKPLPAHR